MSGSEKGHYEVTLTTRRRGWGQPLRLRRSFPFGQWAEIGFWLDQEGAGVEDELTVRFRPWASASAEERWLAILGSDIVEVELGVRAYNILKRRGIDTCAQLLALDVADLDAWDAAHEDDPAVRYGKQARGQIREAQAGLQSLRLQLQAEIEIEAKGGTVEEAIPFLEEVEVVTEAGPEAHEAEHDPQRCRHQEHRIGEHGRPVCVYCGEELEL